MEINIVFIVFVGLVIFRAIMGLKRGVVKQVVSLIAMLMLCAVAALIAEGISSYNSGKIVNVIICVVLFCGLSVAHHLIGLVLFPLKLLAKLPIVSSADKLLGAVFGVLEVVVILWTVYILTMVMDLGAIEQVIIENTQNNIVLHWLYEQNYLAFFIIKFVPKLPIGN